MVMALRRGEGGCFCDGHRRRAAVTWWASELSLGVAVLVPVLFSSLKATESLGLG